MSDDLRIVTLKDEDLPPRKLSRLSNCHDGRAKIKEEETKDVVVKKCEGGDVKKELLDQVKNPKVKVKKARALNDDVLYDRIARLGVERQEPPVSREIMDFAVPRNFMSDTFGGNQQETFPNISKKFQEGPNGHDMNDFMYPSLDWNPAACQLPGAPGLYFDTYSGAGVPSERGPFRVITRLTAGAWLYMGQYKLVLSTPLTPDEWNQQSTLFHRTWTENIASTKWGERIMMRIAARKHFNCPNPTEDQLDAMEESGEFKKFTQADVNAAFARGEESITIWEMRYVGYDVDFQQKIVERFKTWAPRARKLVKGKKRGGKTGAKPKKPVNRKRKRADTTSDESESDLTPLSDSDYYD